MLKDKWECSYLDTASKAPRVLSDLRVIFEEEKITVSSFLRFLFCIKFSTVDEIRSAEQTVKNLLYLKINY